MTHTATCRTCHAQWTIRHPQQGSQCMPCASRDAITALNAELDEMAVERLLSGDQIRATRAERQAAIEYLTRHGMSAREIARRTGMSARTVQRLRARVAA